MERIEQKVPESATDFERMLLSSPNSSYLWLKYMAFYVRLLKFFYNSDFTIYRFHLLKLKKLDN